MLQPARVATPAAAALGLLVQVSVPGPGLVPIARVTDEVSVVTVLPNASRTVTTGWAAKAMPPVLLPGDTVKLNLAGAAAVILNVALVAEISNPSVAVRV